MRRLSALIVALLLAGCAAGPATPAEPGAALEPCRLSAPGATESVAARCLSLSVPEDYTRADSRKIALRIAVVPAISRGAAADPLFLLAGGPGQAASEAFVPLLSSLEPVNRLRDIVLVDQRGTGGSSPLSCPIDSAGDDDEAALLAWARSCLEGIEADPALYTTEAAARDLDAARAALGYEQVNLLGVSYGTRLALTYLRLFPERARSVVLDGVVPQEMAIGASMGRDAQRALDLTFARCAEAPACAAAFPDLPARFAELLADLEAAPAEVALADPFTGAPTSVTLSRELVALTVQSLSYAPETTALLPLLIHTAASSDLRPLAAQYLLVSRELEQSVDLGLRFSVICAEDAPFFPAEPLAPESYLGDQMARALAAPCEEWPRSVAGPELKAPVAADTPALLLSGEFDPVTPPENGEAAARTLPNSLHIVAPGQGHNVFFRGCLPALVADFIEAGSVAELDASCVDNLAAPPFFTSFAAPTP